MTGLVTLVTIGKGLLVDETEAMVVVPVDEWEVVFVMEAGC